MVLVKILQQQIRCLNSLSASITRPHRTKYLRTYPTVLVNPDGSTINIRYKEPRQIIKVLYSNVIKHKKNTFYISQLPLNIWTLSEVERKAKLELRKPKKKVKIVEDIEDNYDSSRYLKYLKK